MNMIQRPVRKSHTLPNASKPLKEKVWVNYYTSCFCSLSLFVGRTHIIKNQEFENKSQLTQLQQQIHLFGRICSRQACCGLLDVTLLNTALGPTDAMSCQNSRFPKTVQRDGIQFVKLCVVHDPPHPREALHCKRME